MSVTYVVRVEFGDSVAIASSPELGLSVADALHRSPSFVVPARAVGVKEA
jgi:hypothetical protein